MKKGIRGALALASKFLFLAVALLAGSLSAQHPVVHRVVGTHIADQFGVAFQALGDVDGDGVPDFAATARQAYREPPKPGPFGEVRLVSGKTGTVVRTWVGNENNPGFGYELAVLKDRDGDGKPELVAAANPNRVVLISPAHDDWKVGLVVETRLKNDYILIRFASGDLDGDGIEDLVIASRNWYEIETTRPFVDARYGRVAAYSGKDWSLLWERIGSRRDGFFGWDVAVIGDIDGDGRREVVASDPGGHYASTEPQAKGDVFVLSGRDGSVLRTITDGPGAYLGHTLLNPGDLDGDGFDELLISSPGYTTNRGRDQGWVGVYSTRTWQVIRSFTGVDGQITSDFHGDALGDRMAVAGDVDIDGVNDLLIGSYRYWGTSVSWGRLDLRSGRSGKLLAVYQENQDSDPWLGGLGPLGDVDGDGRPEFLVGSPYLEIGFGPNDSRGEALVLRYEPGEPRFIRGDANGDGRVNLTDAIAILRWGFFGVLPGPCPRAGDIDADEHLVIGDAIRLIRYLFLGRIAPDGPFPECGRFGGLRESKFACERSTCGE